MVALDFSLVGANGDTIPFDGSQDYVLSTGFRGVGIPTTDVRIDTSAGDGGTWRSTRRGLRELDLPIVVLGANRDDVESKLRRLSRALNDRYGTPKLIAQYSDGTSYSIEVHYTGGAETVFGGDASETFCRWGITLTAPDPFWVSTQAVNFSLGYSEEVRGLLPNLEQLKVSPSQVVGSYVIENPGDVEAYPVWTLEGASTGASFLLNGVGFTYTETLTAGKIIVNTRAATVVDAAGANKYAYLGAAPKLFAIPPGTSTVSLTVEGADSSTKVSGYFQPRREVLH